MLIRVSCVPVCSRVPRLCQRGCVFLRVSQCVFVLFSIQLIKLCFKLPQLITNTLFNLTCPYSSTRSCLFSGGPRGDREVISLWTRQINSGVFPVLWQVECAVHNPEPHINTESTADTPVVGHGCVWVRRFFMHDPEMKS